MYHKVWFWFEFRVQTAINGAVFEINRNSLSILLKIPNQLVNKTSYVKIPLKKGAVEHSWIQNYS